MAELVAVVLSALLPKALNAMEGRIDSMLEFRAQLESMKGHVEAIEAVLADAESKKTGQRVSLWLNNVSGVAFEAEIVLDKLLYKSLRRQVLQTNGEVRSSFLFKLESRIRDIHLSMKLGSKVQRINANFEKLNGQVTTLKLDNGGHHATGHVAANRETNSATHRFVEKRVEEVSDIVKLLLDSSNNNIRVSVLPIFGLGGLGKTTLAKSVYNDPEIKGRFSKRSWTCVSNEVGCTDIFKGILESLRRGKSVGISQQDGIVKGIQEELKGERFLFVLDDIWEFKWWGDFLNTVTDMVGLNSTGGGCCVLITTRLERVANDACASPFRLKKLPDDQCWSIIGERVKEGGKKLEGLEVYKEQLLKRCQGLPLAANAIGGLLRREDWGLIVDRVLKIQEDVEGEIGPVLKLSYDYLPSRCIKKCFVYCSVYPKDAELYGENLIELWMAEGFLQEGVEGGRTMEEVGASYLTILLQSSLLETYAFGEFQMHDLVHDLACFISKQEKHDGERYRHVILGEKDEVDEWNINKSSTLIRIDVGVSGEIILKYRHARVMHLSNREVQKLPNAIGKLKHVRCLTLSLGGIKSLPESLCKLYHLQTLALNGCGNLQCLPQKLSNLISLRHLCYDENGKLKMAPNMGRLTRLQILHHFNVGEENGCEITELGFMKNLKGSIGIHNLELVEGKEAATSADLFNKKNLTTLALNWGSTTTRRNSDNTEDVLEGLEPCHGLQELKIASFMGIRCPGWLGKLSSLVVLRLYDCSNMRELGYSGDSGFPNLKDLWIWDCPLLSSVRTSFPILEVLNVSDIQVSGVSDIISTTTNSLQDLCLQGVSGMKSLSDVIESSLSSCLRGLDIQGCDELAEIRSSSLECLETLRVLRCPELVSCPLNLQLTPCLSVIEFRGCPKLFTRDAVVPRGFQHLTNLNQLWIGDSEESATMDWDGLRKGCSTTLRHLHILGSSGTQLPQQLQDFSSLVWLELSGLDSLERLPGWLAKLTSLQTLQLLDCPKLEHLPTDAIRSLTNLLYLTISGCPLLRETQGDEIEKALPNVQVYWTDD